MRGTSADQVLLATDAAAPRTATSTTMITTECMNTSGTVHAHLDQPGANQEMPGVVRVDQTAYRAGQEKQRDAPGGKQQGDLVRAGRGRPAAGG